MPTPAIKLILETPAGMPNVDVSKVFIQQGIHLNNMFWDHVELHGAARYFSGEYNNTLGASTAMDLAIVVGQNLEPHIVAMVEAQGNATMEIFEGAALDSNPGTLLVPRNRFRGGSVSQDVSTSSVYSSPNIDDLGTQLGPTRFIPGGTQPTAGGGSGREDELIFKLGETYIFRTINITAQANPVGVLLDWYEHVPLNL